MCLKRLINMKCFQKIIVIILLCPLIKIHAQEITIEGVIKEKNTNIGVEMVSIILTKYQTNKIIAYTTSSTNGVYKVDAEMSEGIYTLKTRHLGYNSVEKEIVITEKQNQKITIDLTLSPKLNRLDEVIVKREAPIIIKKDTVIYNIKHWAKETDQTLEQVLAKIQGFKILPNGEIQVNGKLIKKVLIDGKEVSGAGASILTKSLDPNDIKNVEVRFDEENNKIKESLLDTEDYAVLDIKLKKGLNKSFFGKLRLTNGYQNKYKIGGYANLFSLNKKANFHLFGEHDAFGSQTISLKNIRNIGKEAFLKIFELPADFQSLTEKEEYHSEIYGFNDYILSDKNVIGVTSKFEISKKWSLFFGSFNSLDRTNQAKIFEQQFITSTQTLQENQSFRNISSKNKLELKFDTKDTKARFDTNFIYANHHQETINNLNNTALNYDFDDKNKSLSFYNNLFFEHKLSKKMGLELKASHSHIELENIVDFKHNDPTYVLVDANNSIVNNLLQRINSESNQINAQAKLQYLTKLGVFEVGNLLENRVLFYKSLGENRLNNELIVNFTQNKEKYTFNRIKPFINHMIDFGEISLTNKFGYSFVKYPDKNNRTVNNKLIDYDVNLDYSPSNFFNINTSYSTRFSSFPLVKRTKANTVLDFQTIEIEAGSLLPQKESVLSFAISNNFNEIKFNADIALLAGKTQSQNRYLFTESPFITIQRDQLGSNYQAISIILTKKFEKLPITLILEPEAVFNENENIDNNANSYFSKTKRWLLGLKLNSNFKSKPYNFYFYPKYTKFNFQNTLSNAVVNQEMISLLFNTEIRLIEEKLYLDIGFRHVNFSGNVTSKFTNFNAKFSGKIKKINWFLIASNLTNDRKFIQQQIYPTFFVSQVHQVFGRYIKLGIEYKFK